MYSKADYLLTDMRLELTVYRFLQTIKFIVYFQTL